MDKKYFFIKLIPQRASFTVDMTDDERAIMYAHIAYWAPHVQAGTMIVMGPVADPNGGYGVGIIGVETEDVLHELIKNDPANGLNRYEIFPMPAASHKK
jgi:hypothetical protein